MSRQRLVMTVIGSLRASIASSDGVVMTLELGTEVASSQSALISFQRQV